MRMAVISSGAKPGLISNIVQAAVRNLEGTAAVVLLNKLLKEETVKKLESGKKKLGDYDIPGVDMPMFVNLVDEVSEDLYAVQSEFAKSVLGFAEGDNGVIVNGRIIGPLGAEEELTVNDLDLLEKLTMAQYGEKLVQAFHNHLDVTGADISDKAMYVAALLMN